MAGTSKSRFDLADQDLNSLILDNMSKLIIPGNHRQSNEDMVASATNFIDDNFVINGDGSHEYSVDPTGLWDGSPTHDLKLAPKKYIDDLFSAIFSGTANRLVKYDSLGTGIEDSYIDSTENVDWGAVLIVTGKQIVNIFFWSKL